MVSLKKKSRIFMPDQGSCIKIYTCKIAFLALDDIHHLHHIVPIAAELAHDENFHSVIYVQQHCLPLTQQILTMLPPSSCRVEVLAPALSARIIRKLRGGMSSSRGIIRRHWRTLLEYDALFTPDINLQELIQRARRQAKTPVFFANQHGAGDGERPFHLLADYDFLLLAGEKQVRQFRHAGCLQAANYAITGYPKFDVIPENFCPQLFTNDSPVILYNPHSTTAISSWPHWGIEVLEFFYQHRQYNLIFAPHCNLFRRHVAAKTIPRKYFSADNILMDLGSENSVNMTYTQAADIYLGDVSSQVYEFIRKPRPCLFLNPHQVNWQDNEYYSSWNLGPVINRFAELESLLLQSLSANPYAALQQQYFADTFSVTTTSAAARTAAAIRQKMRMVILPPS
jgi:hypothetical protein